MELDLHPSTAPAWSSWTLCFWCSGQNLAVILDISASLPSLPLTQSAANPPTLRPLFPLAQASYLLFGPFTRLLSVCPRARDQHSLWGHPRVTVTPVHRALCGPALWSVKTVRGSKSARPLVIRPLLPLRYDLLLSRRSLIGLWICQGHAFIRTFALSVCSCHILCLAVLCLLQHGLRPFELVLSAWNVLSPDD